MSLVRMSHWNLGQIRTVEDGTWHFPRRSSRHSLPETLQTKAIGVWSIQCQSRPETSGSESIYMGICIFDGGTLISDSLVSIEWGDLVVKFFIPSIFRGSSLCRLQFGGTLEPAEKPSFWFNSSEGETKRSPGWFCSCSSNIWLR